MTENVTLLQLIFLITLLPVGLFLAPIFAALVFDGQYGHNTLKNEAVYGIPRSRIYLGKLFAAILAGSMAAGIVLLWFFLLCIWTGWTAGNDGIILSEVLMVIAGAWFTWLAALSFTMLLLFTLQSASAAMAIVFILSAVGIPFCLVTKKAPSLDSFDPFHWFAWLYYAAPYGRLLSGFSFEQAGGVLFLKGGAVMGLSWVLITTALGLAIFCRRELS